MSEHAAEADWFRGVPELLEAAGIPAVDLRDTFAGIEDLAPLRASAADQHPTDLGHTLLFERLVAKLIVSPAASQCLAGGTNLSGTR